jgi:hypothetical protein
MNNFPCDNVTQFEGTYDIQGISTHDESNNSSDFDDDTVSETKT